METVSTILSFIVLLGAAAAVIFKLIKPTVDIRKMVKDHDDRLKRIERHEKNDLQALDQHTVPAEKADADDGCAAQSFNRRKRNRPDESNKR